MATLAYILSWRKLIYGQYYQGKKPKRLIVNELDFNDYTEQLAKLNGGLVPTLNGEVHYKAIPLGISNALGRNDCALEM